MNLNAIAGAAAAAVNPPVSATLTPSTGYTTPANGKRVPTYGAAIGPVRVQVQALTGRDLQHMDALNIQGTMRALYFNGNVEGLDRPAGRGGDLFTWGDQTWLVTQVLEAWDTAGWTKVAVTLQNS